jgi:hypothetical protein
MFRCRPRVRWPIYSNSFDSRFTVKTVKQVDSGMIWGCFSGPEGCGGLYFLPKNTTMRGEYYKTVLKDHLTSFMAIYCLTHFLRDRAPCHGSKHIKDFLHTRTSK